MLGFDLFDHHCHFFRFFFFILLIMHSFNLFTLFTNIPFKVRNTFPWVIYQICVICFYFRSISLISLYLALALRGGNRRTRRKPLAIRCVSYVDRDREKALAPCGVSNPRLCTPSSIGNQAQPTALTHRPRWRQDVFDTQRKKQRQKALAPAGIRTRALFSHWHCKPALTTAPTCRS